MLVFFFRQKTAYEMAESLVGSGWVEEPESEAVAQHYAK